MKYLSTSAIFFASFYNNKYAYIWPELSTIQYILKFICFISLPDLVGLKAVVVLILQCLFFYVCMYLYIHIAGKFKGKFWPIATFKKSGLGFLGWTWETRGAEVTWAINNSQRNIGWRRKIVDTEILWYTVKKY